MQGQPPPTVEYIETTAATSPALSQGTLALIERLTATLTLTQLADKRLAVTAMARAAALFGDLANSTGNFWDTRDFQGDLMLGKFVYNGAVGLIPGTTLEQHGATDFFARDILGALDDQYVVDQLEQVRNNRPISLMGYISGGTSQIGQIGIQLDPALLYQPEPQSKRLYKTIIHCAYLLLQNGFDPHKPVVMHAELNNRYGISRIQKTEYELLRGVGVPLDELPRYRTQVYLTMPQVLPCNDDLLCEDLIHHDLGYWARQQ